MTTIITHSAKNLLLLILSTIPFSTRTLSQMSIATIGSGAWNNPLVWDCSCVPGANDDVIINQYNFVIVTDTAKVNNLEIYPNGEVILETGEVLEIKGNSDIGGDLIAETGHIILNGDYEQYFDAGGNTVAFNDLTINNSAYPVTFYEAQYSLSGTLFPKNGGLILDETPNNQFVFKSTDDATSARIDKVINSFFFTGKFTVERNIPSGLNGSRNLSASVKDASFNMWDATVGIFGPTLPDGCSGWTTTCENTLSFQLNGSENPIQNINDTASVGLGYDITLGTDSLNFFGATLSMTGGLNDNIDVEVSVGSGWETKGNPYVSAIDFNKLARTGVTNYFYVYSTETGSYEWYDGSTNTSSCTELTNGIIATGQGFFVTGPGMLTFSDSAKVAGSGVLVKSDVQDDDSFLLTLSKTSSQQKCTMSMAVLSGTTDGFDQNADVLHLMTGKEKSASIGVVAEAQILRKNFFSNDASEKTFNLFTRIKHAGEYMISIENVENFIHYNTILLTDLLTGEIINLKETSYHFNSEAGDFERFVLTLTNTYTAISNDLTNESGLPFSIQTNPNNDQIQITNFSDTEQTGSLFIYDMAGHTTVLKINQSITPGTTTLALPELSGVQILVLELTEGRITKKIILE